MVTLICIRVIMLGHAFSPMVLRVIILNRVGEPDRSMRRASESDGLLRPEGATTPKDCCVGFFVQAHCLMLLSVIPALGFDEEPRR